jgi:hypothetical protein
LILPILLQLRKSATRVHFPSGLRAFVTFTALVLTIDYVDHLLATPIRSILRDAKVLSTHSRMKSFAIIVSPPRVAAQSFTADLSSSAMISERMIVNFCIALYMRLLGVSEHDPNHGLIARAVAYTRLDHSHIRQHAPVTLDLDRGHCSR